MSLPPDMPPAIVAAIRSAARQAFEAGARRGKTAVAAEVEQVLTYAVNTVAYAWVVESAQAEAAAQDPH